jgi:hypothetical protein
MKKVNISKNYHIPKSAGHLIIDLLVVGVVVVVVVSNEVSQNKPLQIQINLYGLNLFKNL